MCAQKNIVFDFDIVVKKQIECGLAWSVLVSTTSTRLQHFDHCDDAYSSIKEQTTLKHIRLMISPLQV